MRTNSAIATTTVATTREDNAMADINKNAKA